MASDRGDDLKDDYRGHPPPVSMSQDPNRFYYMGGGAGPVGGVGADGGGGLLGAGRPTPRRTKRHVPDTEKDSKYWEKRKRNNDAARRSRETKRRMDVDIRSRVLLLEEELSLARKELTVIKVKFGLPLDQRFLATDAAGELVPTAIGSGSLSGALSPLTAQLSADGMNTPTSYSLPPTSGSNTTDSHTPLGQVGRSGSSAGRHQDAPHINTQLDRLGPESQTSPSDNMPVKKRRRGRKEWEDSDDQVADLGPEGPAGSGSEAAYYSRMLAGSPYAGLVWPSTTPGGGSGGGGSGGGGGSAPSQFSFASQMAPMLGAAAAYQALVDEQQRLPSINAFSSGVPTSIKAEQESAHHQQQQAEHQQHQQNTGQQHPPHTNGNRSSNSATPDSFEYLENAATANSGGHHSLGPRYYVPYSSASDSTRPPPASHTSPADLSLTTKGQQQQQQHDSARHQQQQSLDMQDQVAQEQQPTRTVHHQQIGVVQPMQGSHHHQQQQQQLHQQHHQHQQNLQHQQHQQQQQQQRGGSAGGLSSGASEDEEEHQERLMVENSDIRSRLQQLTAEVAKMKDYVLKDTAGSPMPPIATGPNTGTTTAVNRGANNNNIVEEAQ